MKYGFRYVTAGAYNPVSEVDRKKILRLIKCILKKNTVRHRSIFSMVAMEEHKLTCY